jgi:hypothetical protein
MVQELKAMGNSNAMAPNGFSAERGQRGLGRYSAAYPGQPQPPPALHQKTDRLIDCVWIFLKGLPRLRTS